MNFWIKSSDDTQWHPLPAHGESLPAGVYTIIVQSPQPHFTLPIHRRLYPLDSTPDRKPQALAATDTTTRTNEEGIAVILPAMVLTPGWWEWCCRDGDLIAELFGDPQLDTLVLKVIPAASSPSPASAPSPALLDSSPLLHSDPPPPAATPPVVPTLDTNDFVLMRQQLAGSPGSKVIVTGRTGYSGEILIELRATDGLLISQRTQTIQMWGEAKTVAFSIPLILPDHEWPQPLQGVAQLWVGSQILVSQSFLVTCQSEPVEPIMNWKPRLWQDNELEPVASLPLADPLPSLEESGEQSRTFLKLLRLSQLAPPPLSGEPRDPSSPAADPVPSPRSETAPSVFASPIPPADSPSPLPLPAIVLPETLSSQQTVDIILTLADPPPLPVYAKVWVCHGQSGDLLDGPRWLLEWEPHRDGSRRATTRMTIPHLKTELVWFACTVDPTTQQESEPVKLSRMIRK